MTLTTYNDLSIRQRCTDPFEHANGAPATPSLATLPVTSSASICCRSTKESNTLMQHHSRTVPAADTTCTELWYDRNSLPCVVVSWYTNRWDYEQSRNVLKRVTPRCCVHLVNVTIVRTLRRFIRFFEFGLLTIRECLAGYSIKLDVTLHAIAKGHLTISHVLATTDVVPQ